MDKVSASQPQDCGFKPHTGLIIMTAVLVVRFLNFVKIPDILGKNISTLGSKKREFTCMLFRDDLSWTLSPMGICLSLMIQKSCHINSQSH